MDVAWVAAVGPMGLGQGAGSLSFEAAGLWLLISIELLLAPADAVNMFITGRNLVA